MSIELIIGDSSTGKSNLLCKKMVERSLKDPSAHFIALVPEQATLLMQKRVIDIHPEHIVSNIDIVSFNFLAHTVFDETGSAPFDILDDTGKTLILKRVLDDIKDELDVYASKVRMPGFINEAKSIITELKQYDIDDNTLFLMQEAASDKGNRLLFSKISDIRKIYQRFNESIAERYTTAEEILDIFARVVPESEIIKGAHIYMDGFTGFTPVQYKLIDKFAEYAEDVTVSVTLPEDKVDQDCKEHELFFLSNQTFHKLKDIAGRHDEEVSITVCGGENKKEKHICANIFAGGVMEDEISFAAKQILKFVKHEGYRFRDFAIIACEMESYHRSIRKIFDEAGISYFIDHKNTLIDNMMAHFVLAAGKVAEERFSFDSVFAYLKTGLTSLDDDSISRLENYCLEFGIRGIRAFSEDFYKNRNDGAYDLDALNGIRKEFMSGISGFYEAVSKGRKTAADHYAAYIDLFEKNEIKQKMDDAAKGFEEDGDLPRSMEYEQIYEKIIELLDKIKNIMADVPLSAKEFSELMAEGLNEMKVGTIPPSLDAVIVGDLTRTRLDDVRALFFIGANEGNIPGASSGSLIFSQREREFLKERYFDIAPTVLENIFTQRFYIYMMLKKPSDRLWLTYALTAPDGTSLSPSYMVSDVSGIVPGIEKEEVTEDPDETWEGDSMRRLAKNLQEPDEGLLNFFAREKPDSLRQMMDAAFFSNMENDLDKDVAKKLYGEILKGSVSRYERFAECPFKHFLEYGLKIAKRPEYEVEATGIGTIYHECLEKYSKKLQESGFTYRDVPDDESKKIVTECVKEAADEADSDILKSTARNTFLMKRIFDVSQKTVNVLRDHVKRGKYEPEYFELKFESDISDDVRFTGKIDRVDVYDGGDIFVKIIDYKSGSKQFDITDIYTGEQLQLVAYLNEAVKKIKNENPGKNVYPGGVYYYLINDKFTKDEEEALLKNRMSGLTNSDPDAVKALDEKFGEGENMKSSIAELSIRYGKLSDTHTADNFEFENLISYVDEKIKDIGKAIREGDIKINPLYKKEDDNACIYCDYRDVCKFDGSMPGANWNLTKGQVSKKQAEEELLGRRK